MANIRLSEHKCATLALLALILYFKSCIFVQLFVVFTFLSLNALPLF